MKSPRNIFERRRSPPPALARRHAPFLHSSREISISMNILSSQCLVRRSSSSSAHVNAGIQYELESSLVSFVSESTRHDPRARRPLSRFFPLSLFLLGTFFMYSSRTHILTVTIAARLPTSLVLFLFSLFHSLVDDENDDACLISRLSPRHSRPGDSVET